MKTIELYNPEAKYSLRQLLIELFSRLDDLNISYCVLRNYEGLPEQIGNDIDMLISPSQVEIFERCILDASKEFRWKLLKMPKRFGYRSYWFYSNTSGEFVHFDAWSKITWKGLQWANEKFILTRRIRQKQFYIPDAVSETYILFLKDLIQEGTIKDKYLISIQQEAGKYPDEFLEMLQWGLGNHLAQVLFNLLNTGEWEKIQALTVQIRRAVLIRNVLRNPLNPIWGSLGFLLGHFKSLITNSNGFFIALIGPDGAGKSTIANGLMESLSKVFPSQHYYHGRFGMVPQLRTFLNIARRLVGRTPLPPAPCGIHAIHDLPAHGRVKAIIYLLYYSIDYFLGHWLIQRSRSKGELVVFDRYVYDYFMQDLFKHLPRWLLKPLLLILPQPDLVVYLRNSPEVIRQRKPELTEEQIGRQNQICERLVNRLSYAVAISTEQPISQVVTQVSQQVLEMMINRHIKRGG